MLDFADYMIKENSEVFLTSAATELYEDRKSNNFDKIFTRSVAIWGGITGTIALIAELMPLFR